MAVVTKTEAVTAAIDDAWARITDLANSAEWNVVHVGYPEGHPTELAEGVTYKESVRIMGMPGEVSWTVKAVEKPHTLELEGAGPMGTTLRATFRLESDGESTKVTYETEFGGQALAAMAAPLENASRQAAEESMGKLKALLAG